MLKARVRHAATAGSPWPEPDPDSAGSDLPAEGDAHQRLCLRVPAAVREAFAEALDLYRAVEGHAALAGEFVESLIAEAGSGAMAGKVDLEALKGEAGGGRECETAMPATRGQSKIRRTQQRETAVVEGGQDHEMKTTNRHPWEKPTGGSPSKEAPAGLPVQEAIYQARARLWLQEILGDDHEERDDTGGWPGRMTGTNREAGSSTAGRPSPAATADVRMRRLLSLHEDIERQLAEVVTQLADAAAWPALGYVGFNDYARRGLGWSRSTLYNRVQLVRRLRRLPVVREAYQQGRIGRVAAQSVARVLTREAPTGTVPLRIPDAMMKPVPWPASWMWAMMAVSLWMTSPGMGPSTGRWGRQPGGCGP
jgi:hypothetical protein